MERKIDVLHTLRTVTRNLTATTLRVALIFVILLIAFDSLSRLYYSYMPISTWINFKSVSVTTIDGDPTVIIDRVPVGPQIAVFHRALYITYPSPAKGCTASVMTVMDNPTTDQIVVPLSSILSDTCPTFLGDRKIDGNLQVAYIFDFPFGVKRMSVRHSAPFSLSYAGGKYRLGEASRAK